MATSKRRPIDETFEEAKSEAKRRVFEWRRNAHHHERRAASVAELAGAAACTRWFLVIVVADMMDRFDAGERADFLDAIQKHDATL